MTGEARGIVVSFDEERGFGFIRAPGFSGDVFVHVSAIVGDRALRPGQRVRFVAEDSDRGPRASRVHPGQLGLTPALASAALLLGFLLPATIGLKAIGLPWPVSWAASISAATLAVWAWDKNRAIRKGRRVPEAALLGLAALGGTIGALLGVGLLGHKRRKPKVLISLGAIAVVQLIVVAMVMFRS